MFALCACSYRATFSIAARRSSAGARHGVSGGTTRLLSSHATPVTSETDRGLGGGGAGGLQRPPSIIERFWSITEAGAFELVSEGVLICSVAICRYVL